MQEEKTTKKKQEFTSNSKKTSKKTMAAKQLNKEQNTACLETDLYPPVCHYLLEQGYSVYGEVKNCDIAAVKNGELIVVELKRSFTATLLMQATHRQQAADAVYVAVPRPTKDFAADFRQGMIRLVRRLELGLIIVSWQGEKPIVEIMQHPEQLQRRRNKKLRLSMLREIDGRSGNYNVGGSSRCKLMTAYRENAIQIACFLECHAVLSPASLRQLGTGSKTQSILRKNVYGWFERVQRGLYTLSDKGKKSINAGEYPELVAHYRQAAAKSLVASNKN